MRTLTSQSMHRTFLIRSAFLGTALACMLLTARTSVAGSSTSATHAARWIEIRQEGFNKLGWASKAINDQLKRTSPDLQRVTAAARSIAQLSPDVVHWFPAGSGPESGADTSALPRIWTERARFDSLARQMSTEAGRLASLLPASNIETIRTQFKSLRDICSTCHRAYLARR